MKQSIITPLCISVLLATATFAADPAAPSVNAYDPAPAGPAPQATTAYHPAGSAPGFLIGADVGAFWLNDLSASSGPFTAKFKFKTDWGLTVPVGYDFGNGFSTFLTVGYYDSGYQTKGANNGPGVNPPGHVIPSGLVGYLGGESQSAQSGGDLSFVPIMFNASYQVNLFDHCHWYLGGGLGVVREDADFQHFDFPSTQSIVFGALNAGVHQFGGMSGTSWEFAFQVFTGLNYDISDNVTANLGYRYLNMGGGITVDGNSSGRYNGQSVEVGLTFKF